MTGTPYVPQGAMCPRCGRHVRLTIDDARLETHTPLGEPYATACPCTLPAITRHEQGRRP